MKTPVLFGLTIALVCFYLFNKPSRRSKRQYPIHWGDVPKIQTKDLVTLPQPYQDQRGSGTLKMWIEEKQEQDRTSPWDSLVGTNKRYGTHVIESNRPDLTVVLVRDGDPVTSDYRLDRVRIFYHPRQHTIVRPPMIG